MRGDVCEYGMSTISRVAFLNMMGGRSVKLKQQRYEENIVEQMPRFGSSSWCETRFIASGFYTRIQLGEGEERDMTRGDEGWARYTNHSRLYNFSYHHNVDTVQDSKEDEICDLSKICSDATVPTYDFMNN